MGRATDEQPLANAAAATDAADAQPAASSPTELVVVTLNAWGLLGLSKQREARMDALCDWLADPLRHRRPPAPPGNTLVAAFAADFWRERAVDVVLLQEVWVAADARRLASAARLGGLAHSVHFCSGAFGAGLVTISRFPVAAARLHVFAARGDPCAVFSGDYYAAKGVGWCGLAVPGLSGGGAPVHVFNTHLCSNYRHTFRPLPLLPQEEEEEEAGKKKNKGRAAAAAAAADKAGDSGVRVPTDADAATRVAQVLELCDFVQEVSGLGCGSGEGGSRAAAVPPPRVVLGGDLNSEPDTLEVALLRARLPELSDAWAGTAAWRTANHNNDNGNADGSSSNNRGPGAPAVEGYTCRSPLCGYAPRRQVPERIDYVWSTLGARAAALDLAKVPAGGHSYSDHLAVRAALALSDGGAAGGAPAAAAAGGGGNIGSGKGNNSSINPPLIRPGSGVAALLLRRARPGGADAGGSGGGGGGTTTTATTMTRPDDNDNDSGRSSAVSRAALVGAAVVLSEGAEEFAGLASGNTLLGGLALVTTLYAAVAAPLLLPGFVRWLVLESPARASAAALLLTLAGAGGFALFTAGFLAARSQQSALVMALRSHVLRMRRMGLVPVVE